MGYTAGPGVDLHASVPAVQLVLPLPPASPPHNPRCEKAISPPSPLLLAATHRRKGRQHADIGQGRAVGDFAAGCVRQARGRGASRGRPPPDPDPPLHPPHSPVVHNPRASRVTEGFGHRGISPSGNAVRHSWASGSALTTQNGKERQLHTRTWAAVHAAEATT